MQIVDSSISRKTLVGMSEKMFDELVKAVADVEKRIMYVDAPMHADMEKALLEEGSLQKNLWTIYQRPNLTGEGWN